MFIESPHPNYSVSIAFSSHLYLLYDVINTPNTKFSGQELIQALLYSTLKVFSTERQNAFIY